MPQVKITDVTLRDAHQCLIATRLRTQDMLPICPKLDAIGFWALEVWGGATFDACLRFLKEDPWERLRNLRSSLPNTPLSMLLRGQNLLGYRHYADDVVREFVRLASNNGIDVFRIFDALNDTRNLSVAIETVKKMGKHAQGAISYTTSPFHSIANFVEMGKELAKMGCDSIAIKDMAGLLTPVLTSQLVSELQQTTGLDIHLHSHSTSGLASVCHYKAIENGCSHIDTAISSFAEGASHPCTESMVAALEGTEFATGLDLTSLEEIGDYFKEIRKKYHQYESEATGIDPRVQLYQVPGGMISNLYNQLKEQNALDKMEQVHQEIPRVRKELGYPPLVTPTSQVVGTQAVLNVLTGKRYQTITNEVKLYCQGKYGKPPGQIDPEVRKQAIGNTEFIEVRPASLLNDELATITQECQDIAQSEEDIISYALFPEVASTYFNEKARGELNPEQLKPIAKTVESGELSDFTISLHGESYHVKVAGCSNNNGYQSFYLSLDGVPEEVLIEPIGIKKAKTQSNSRPSISLPGDVTVAMPSTVVEVKVNKGEKVKAGQAVLVTEAMKMETETQAPIAGTVVDINCQKGDKVNPNELLIRIE
jgi:pyruvate carboxylase subunit B